MDRIEGGKIFRQAWIDGVKRHFPGEPKPGYIASWGDMSAWEQEAAIESFDQITAFLHANPATQLSDEQGGRLVRLIWVIQIYQRVPTPKPAYVQPWEAMPEWEQCTDIEIFQAISKKAVIRALDVLSLNEGDKRI